MKKALKNYVNSNFKSYLAARGFIYKISILVYFFLHFVYFLIIIIFIIINYTCYIEYKFKEIGC